jgi:hypothetical protein
VELHRGRQATSDALRALLSACLMLSAVVHLDLWATGMRSVDIVGPAFLLNGIGGIVLGVLVLVWRHWLPLLGAIGFGVATLGAFILATTPSGFFQVHSRWSGIPEWLAAISEIGVIALGIATIVVERRPARAETSVVAEQPA